MAAMRVKASEMKKKAPPAVETHSSIDDAVSAFLKAGGQIQEIPKGVSGQVFAPSRHITLGKK
ncbi:hypothetical protein [Pseudomonas sp. GV071]|jgi:hypothetical protein|uniref:hypothetical protein n=1 Tax=Pseudomonas sp. GV071 TaxID=2135754 RepID=UPI0015AE2F7F|nr:hypothetical protein [Pseudomonas sp. GV071]